MLLLVLDRQLRAAQATDSPDKAVVEKRKLEEEVLDQPHTQAPARVGSHVAAAASAFVGGSVCSRRCVDTCAASVSRLDHAVPPPQETKRLLEDHAWLDVQMRREAKRWVDEAVAPSPPTRTR